MSCSTKAGSIAEKCAFVQVAVPSRTDVPAYEDERDEVETLVDAINAKHRRRDGSRARSSTSTPRSTRPRWPAWFRAADALVVTSLADGMNLVAKEFVAARGDLDGALILSEFAGAAQDLDGALIVNPYDIEAIKRCTRRRREHACRGTALAYEDDACPRCNSTTSTGGRARSSNACNRRRRFAPAISVSLAIPARHRRLRVRHGADDPVDRFEGHSSWTLPSSLRRGCRYRRRHTAAPRPCSTQLARGLKAAGHQVLLICHPESTCPVPKASVIPVEDTVRMGRAEHRNRERVGAYELAKAAMWCTTTRLPGRSTRRASPTCPSSRRTISRSTAPTTRSYGAALPRVAPCGHLALARVVDTACRRCRRASRNRRRRLPVRRGRRRLRRRCSAG